MWTLRDGTEVEEDCFELIPAGEVLIAKVDTGSQPLANSTA